MSELDAPDLLHPRRRHAEPPESLRLPRHFRAQEYREIYDVPVGPSEVRPRRPLPCRGDRRGSWALIPGLVVLGVFVLGTLTGLALAPVLSEGRSAEPLGHDLAPYESYGPPQEPEEPSPIPLWMTMS